MNIRSVSFLIATAAFTASALFPGSSYAFPSQALNSNVSCFTCHSKTTVGSNAINGFVENQSSALSINVPFVNMKAGLKIHSDPAWQILEDSNGATPLQARLAPDENNGVILKENTAPTIVSGYLSTNRFMASVGLLNPLSVLSSPRDESVNPSLWYRLAYTPKFAGLDFTLGVFGMAGKSNDETLLQSATLKDPLTRSFGLDAHVYGRIGYVTLDLKTVYLNSGDGNGQARQIYQNGIITDGFGASAKVGLTNSFGLSASYRTFHTLEDTVVDGTHLIEKEATIGAWFNLTDNIVFQPQYTTFDVNRQIINKDGEFRLRFFTGF